MSAYTCCSDVPFNNLVKFMQKCSEVRNKDKEKQFQHFLEKNVPRKAQDIFQAFRLLMPAEDLDRRSYGAKEDRLAKLLVSAAGLSADSADAKHALNWKRSGRHAGQFPEMMEQYVLRNACRADGADVVKKITVAQVNESLDRLALAANDNHQQVKILGDLMGHCSSLQMKWITRIIVKDLKIGMSKERMLRIFHPDAMELLNITSDLKRVCLELADPAARMARKDVEPGCCVKAQLCGRANSVEDCYAKMKGQPFTVEVKFDGNRLQIHRSEDSVYYFSRRGREHGGMSDYDVFDQVVQQQVLSPKVILDGEMVVWNKSHGVFEAFGGLRSSMIAAKEGVPKNEIVRMTDRGQDYNADPNYVHPTAGDIELVYIAFDLLFMGEESILTRPLHERQQLLAQVIKCVPADQPGIPCGAGTISGRVVALIPDQPVPLPLPNGTMTAEAEAAGAGGDMEASRAGSMPAVSCAALSELVFSRVGRSLADVQAMYDMALSRQEEGIVVKQLNSPWKPDDRSNTWLKMKPDYVTNAEVDAVIIGVYMGQSRRAGQVSEFLLGLTEGGGAGWGADAVKWCSFCRVGTGMSDAERQQVHERLLPVLTPAGPGTKPPRCYRVSGKEKPDFWVSDPQRSVVVEVKSDIRTITSKMYAADYSLRFPRVTRLCWDRSALDITSYAQLERDVAENKGMITSMRLNMQLGVGAGGKRTKRSTPRKTAARKGGRQLVVAAAQLPDVSGVSQVDDLLLGKKVAFLNYCSPSASSSEKSAAKQKFAEMVARHGGIQQVMKGPETDYVFAAHLSISDAAALSKKEATNPRAVHDVISTEWLIEVDQAGELLAIMPRHRLYLTYQGRLELAGRDDEFGDHDIFSNTYLQDVNAADVAALVTTLIPDNELVRYQQQLAAGQQQLQQQLEAADTLTVAADGDDEQQASLVAPDAPRTAQSVMLELQHELQMQTGWRDNRATLFAGCCLLFLPSDSSSSSMKGDLKQTEHTLAAAAAATRAVAGADIIDLVLLHGVQTAQTAAAALAAAVAKQQLADVKLAVLLHGGSVAETYSSQVTHIVLWPVGPVQQQRQQQWLLQQQHQQEEKLAGPQDGSKDLRPHVWPWCEILMPGQSLQLSGQQLVSQLAAAAVAAANADAAAAAADAAARSRPSSTRVMVRGHQQHRRAKVQPPPLSAAAVAAPPPPTTTATDVGPGKAEPSAAVAAVGGGIKALSARLAAGESHVMEHVLGDQQQAASEPQLSPGALKHLRLLRRRLLAAQATDNHSPNDLRTGPSASKAGKRRRTLAIPDLYIVNPCWVTDSLSQVGDAISNDNDNNTNALTYGLIQRCSEILYAPVVQQQQQQQQEEQKPDGDAQQAESAAAAAAAAAVVDGGSADVLRWPWQQYGLGPPGGSSSSSSGSSDGDGSASESGHPQKKRQRNANTSSKPAAAKKPASRTRQRKQATAVAADDAEEESTPAPRKAAAGKRRRTAAAAEVVDTDEGQQQQRRQQRGRGGRGRGRGRGHDRRVVKSDSSSHEDDYNSGTEIADESDMHQDGSQSHAGQSPGGEVGNAETDASPAAAPGRQQDASQDASRPMRSRRGRAVKHEAAVQPPGWLFSQEDENHQQQQGIEYKQQQTSSQQEVAGADDEATVAAALPSQPATQRLPTRLNRAQSALPRRQQLVQQPTQQQQQQQQQIGQLKSRQEQQEQEEEVELEVAETPDVNQPVLLSKGSLRQSGSGSLLLQQQQVSASQALHAAQGPAGDTLAPAQAAAPPPAAAAMAAPKTRLRGLLGRIFDDDNEPLVLAAAAAQPAAQARASAADKQTAGRPPSVMGIATALNSATAAAAEHSKAGKAPARTDTGNITSPRKPLWQKLGLLDDNDGDGAALPGAIQGVADRAYPAAADAGAEDQRGHKQAGPAAAVHGMGASQQQQNQHQQLASAPATQGVFAAGHQQQRKGVPPPTSPAAGPASQQQLQQEPGARPKRSLLKLKAELDKRRGESSDG